MTLNPDQPSVGVEIKHTKEFERRMVGIKSLENVPEQIRVLFKDVGERKVKACGEMMAMSAEAAKALISNNYSQALELIDQLKSGASEMGVFSLDLQPELEKIYAPFGDWYPLNSRISVDERMRQMGYAKILADINSAIIIADLEVNAEAEIVRKLISYTRLAGLGEDRRLFPQYLDDLENMIRKLAIKDRGEIFRILEIPQYDSTDKNQTTESIWGGAKFRHVPNPEGRQGHREIQCIKNGQLVAFAYKYPDEARYVIFTPDLLGSSQFLPTRLQIPENLVEIELLDAANTHEKRKKDIEIGKIKVDNGPQIYDADAIMDSGKKPKN